MECENCRYFVKCLEWDCFKENCEFYEPLENLKVEELDEIDRDFVKIYEMSFEKFRELVEDLGNYVEQDAVVMRSFEAWKRVAELRDRVKNGGN